MILCCMEWKPYWSKENHQYSNIPNICMIFCKATCLHTIHHGWECNTTGTSTDTFSSSCFPQQWLHSALCYATFVVWETNLFKHNDWQESVLIVVSLTRFSILQDLTCFSSALDLSCFCRYSVNSMQINSTYYMIYSLQKGSCEILCKLRLSTFFNNP